THNATVDAIHDRGLTVQICHGAILDLEHPSLYADYHVGITKEVCDSLSEKGYPNTRSEEHTSELQSRENLVCRLLLEKDKAARIHAHRHRERHREPQRAVDRAHHEGDVRRDIPHARPLPMDGHLLRCDRKRQTRHALP